MEFLIGGLAASSAGFFTNPLEVVKHHMELNNKSQFNSKYKKFFHTGLQAAKQDGLRGLQKGLSPALGAYLVSYGMKLGVVQSTGHFSNNFRVSCYKSNILSKCVTHIILGTIAPRASPFAPRGPRLPCPSYDADGTEVGTYQIGHSKGLTTHEDGAVAVPKSILTSCAGGLLGQYLSNPFYLLKYEHEKDSMQHNSSRCSGYTDTIQRIYRENGRSYSFYSKSLHRNLPVNFFCGRKEELNKFETFRANPLFTTILAGTIAGIVLSMAMTPFELVLTKMYKQAIGTKSNEPRYSGYLDCLKKIYSQKGFKPFYRGMGPIYLKLGPHTVLCLVFWEELKGIYSHNSETTNNNRNYDPVSGISFYDKINFTTDVISNDYLDDNFETSNHNVYWN
ncbi:hypothetical protein NQ317_007089 [Molorchus minor]|uniref:Mitochondrial carrier protein n=1 Tax=Molorchus minor TaxID=1323400 RepID=A0ABQ9K5I2_9CUCU|nr:hypothetical protein NQ317_007089 [Molorchus minor]